MSGASVAPWSATWCGTRIPSGATASSTARSPRTTRWASTTPGAAPTRTSTSASTPCSGEQAALPERLRLPGPLDRGRGREGAGLHVQARHRALRRSTGSSKRARRACNASRPHHRAVDPPRLLDGLGQPLLHELRREQLHDLGLPEASAWATGWIYKGHDTMPWCPRCGTGLSEARDRHRGLPGGDAPVVSRSGCRSPLLEHEGERLLVWTTTPWTLPATSRRPCTPS